MKQLFCLACLFTPTILSASAIIEFGEEAGGVAGVNPQVGEQRTLVALVNFASNPVEPITAEEASRRVFDEAERTSINAYVREVSYGLAYLSGEVHGWLTSNLELARICDRPGELTLEVIDRLDPLVYFPDFGRLIIVIPRSPECPWSGLATLGQRQVQTKDGPAVFSTAWLNGPHNIVSGVGAHELGHNFGLGHANNLNCGERVIADDCRVIFGDAFDLMGNAFRRGHFNALNKEKLGWLAPDNIAVVASRPLRARFVITPLAAPGAGLKLLKLVGANWNYGVEYRRAIGFDLGPLAGWPEDEVYGGAMIRIDRYPGASSYDTHLLDNSPHPDAEQNHSYDSFFVVLRPGQWFSDPQNNLNLRVLTADENLTVEVNRLPLLPVETNR